MEHTSLGSMTSDQHRRTYSCCCTAGLSQKPEVLLPSGADEVPTDAMALLPHRHRLALGPVDALLHELLVAARHHAAVGGASRVRQRGNGLDRRAHGVTSRAEMACFDLTPEQRRRASWPGREPWPAWVLGSPTPPLSPEWTQAYMETR